MSKSRHVLVMKRMNGDVFALDGIYNNSIWMVINLWATYSVVDWLLLLKHLPIMINWMMNLNTAWIVYGIRREPAIIIGW